MKHVIAIAAAALLALPAAAADQCTGLAELAANIAEHKAAGIPQAAVASQLRAQYVSNTEEQRNSNAMVERMIPAVYRLDAKPEDVRLNIFLRCKAGEFDGDRQARPEKGST
jgi:hypothetical protein